MMSNGSGSETFYDDRFRTDGFVFLNSRVGFRDVTDGTSNTVAMSETIRGDGLDVTLPSGTTPTFPYRKMLNGSSGISPSGPSTGGYTGVVRDGLPEPCAIPIFGRSLWGIPIGAQGGMERGAVFRGFVL